MLVRLILNSRPQVIRPPWPPEYLDYRHEPPRLANKILNMREISQRLLWHCTCLLSITEPILCGM